MSAFSSRRSARRWCSTSGPQHRTRLQMQWTEINDRLSGDVTIVDLAGHMTLCEDKPVLGEIVSSYTMVVRRGGALKLCHVSRRLRALLETTRLSGVLEVFDAEE